MPTLDSDPGDLARLREKYGKAIHNCPMPGCRQCCGASGAGGPVCVRGGQARIVHVCTTCPAVGAKNQT